MDRHKTAYISPLEAQKNVAGDKTGKWQFSLVQPPQPVMALTYETYREAMVARKDIAALANVYPIPTNRLFKVLAKSFEDVAKAVQLIALYAGKEKDDGNSHDAPIDDSTGL